MPMEVVRPTGGLLKLKGEEMSEQEYDSGADTLDHIQQVRAFLSKARWDLDRRALVHDQSKLEDPEKAVFDEYTPKLKGTTYGSEEYKGYLEGMRGGLDHHYAANRHHPEHFGTEGVDGMNLLDLVEMFCDWLAAMKRHADGDIRASIEKNRERFRLSPQLTSILHNTARWFEGQSDPTTMETANA